MVIGKTLLDEIEKQAKRQQGEQEEKLRASWALCPSCGKKVTKRQILAEGCWACGWKG